MLLLIHDPDHIIVLTSGQRVILPCQAWVPRVLLRFLSEDPIIFGKRVYEAFKMRKETEAEMRYNLYIDCMPTDDIEDHCEASFESMKKRALSTPGLGSDTER